MSSIDETRNTQSALKSTLAMTAHFRQRAEVVVARSKRTGERYPARTSHLAGDRSIQAPYLHYTDNSRLQVCKCLRAQEHVKAFPVSDDDKGLAIAITRYLGKLGLQSCRQSDFHYHHERQKIQWTLSGVCAERFHYLRREKDTVCRCSKPDHLSCTRVHSSEIRELCAEFFLLNMTETTCTREQWRAARIVVPEPLRESPITSPDIAEPKSRRTTPRRDSFEYDSPSVIELLQSREARSLESQKHRSRPSPCLQPSDYRPSSFNPEDMAHLSNGPNGEADIPENVWRISRPSVYLGQHDTESLVSTPLGSSVIPVQQIVNREPAPRRHRHSTLKLGAEAPGVSFPADSWYGLAHSPDSSGLGSPIKHPSPYAARSPPYSGGSYNTELEAAFLEVSSRETPRPSTLGSAAAPAVNRDGLTTHVAELPSSGIAVELDTAPMNSPYLPHHSPTLRELEGRSLKYVAELTGRRPKAQSTSSKIMTASHRLTRLIDQPLRNARLPCQEDFLSKWVELCSRARPAPVGDCSLCRNSYHAPNQRTIRLTCKHYVHQECLLSNFRTLDYKFGNCPICGMALCVRTLADCIDTDREAIFGRSFTNLRAEERIDFAQRNESIVCWSEEEVAAAQLRLLKDYVDSHADELYQQWRQTGLEPDWHNAVVIPVVQLFKGWNVPTRRCRYFADRDVFYKLIVWAELVRLMNTIHDGVKKLHGDGVPFPQLSELHHKFLLAKDRYETEKKMWPTNRSGVLECEKVAQDVFSIAVSTYLDNHS